MHLIQTNKYIWQWQTESSSECCNSYNFV